MQILKYLLVFALIVFQTDFAFAGIKKNGKAKAKSQVAGPRSASYYKVSAKYFKTPKKPAKVAKSVKLKKSANSKRSIASASAPMKLKLKKAKSTRSSGKKKYLR